MSSVAMTGNDTIIVNSRVLADLPDGDVTTLTFTNDIANGKTGKNGNTIYALNASGLNVEVVQKIIKGSPDDIYLNGLLVSQNSNFAGFILMSGEFIKQVGDGSGNILNDVYVLSGGIFKRSVDAKSNVEGDVEQSVSIYRMFFSNAPRAIG